MSSSLIQGLADKLAIHELVVKYAKGRDTTDPELYRTIFAEDAVIGTGSGMVMSGNLDAILAKVANDIKRFNPGYTPGKTSLAVMRHLTTNIDITLSDDTARSDYYVTTMAYNEADKRPEVIAVTRNVDDYARRDGRWWIVRSTLHFGWENDEMGRVLQIGPYTPEEYRPKRT